MRISIADKKKEAIKRLEILKISPKIIKEFDTGIINITKLPSGEFTFVEHETKKVIDEFEKKYNALVYLIIRSPLEIFKKTDALFFVSDNKDEWEYEKENLTVGRVFAYVHNYDDELCSEFGDIGFRPTLVAGFKRIW